MTNVRALLSVASLAAVAAVAVAVWQFGPDDAGPASVGVDAGTPGSAATVAVEAEAPGSTATMAVNAETPVGTATVEVEAEVPPSYRIVTVLGKDEIPAILNPNMVPAQEVDAVLRDTTPVLALSLNGDHRAYPIGTLSRHEIVNDVVGGMPVAVTW